MAIITPFSFLKRECSALYDGDFDYVISLRIIGKVRSCQCPEEKTIYDLCPKKKKDNLWLMSREKRIYDICPSADIHVHKLSHVIPIFPRKLKFFFCFFIICSSFPRIFSRKHNDIIIRNGFPIHRKWIKLFHAARRHIFFSIDN